MSDPVKPKKLSGSQGRKKRADAAAERQAKARDNSQAWLSQQSYRYAGNQWDPNAPAVELPIFGIPAPTIVKAIQATLLQLEQGFFYQSAILWDGMLRDDRITATINVRTGGLLGQPLDLKPAKDTNRARSIKEDCEKQIAKMMPTPQLAQLLRYAFGLSVGVAQRITTRDAKSTSSTIKVWNNRYLRYDWLLRKYCLVTENLGEIVLEPEDPEWIVYEPFGPLGWIHGALIRALAQPWLIRYWTRNWWGRYQEILGTPIRAGIIPVDREPEDERVFLSQISNLSHEAVVRLPQGKDGNQFDLKLIEASSNNWRGFLELLKHCDDSIAIVLLGQSMSTEGVSGLGSQENAGESTVMRILRQDAQVGDVLREKMLKPWAEDEYGDPEMAPFMSWALEPPEDLDAKASYLLKVAQAVQTFSMAPDFARHVDIRALLEEYELPLRPEDDVPPDLPGTPDSPPGDSTDTEENDGTQEQVEGDGEDKGGSIVGDDAAAKPSRSPSPSPGPGSE